MPVWAPAIATVPALTCARGRGGGQPEAGVQRPHVRESGLEAEHVDDVWARRVDRDHLVRGQAGEPRHLLEIGTVLASVSDRDRDVSTPGLLDS